jgi:hypothetical protein
MNGPINEQLPYSQLIQQMSALAARVDSTNEFARTAVHYVADAFEVNRAALSLRPNANGPVIYQEAQSASFSKTKSKPRFLFSRTIAIRNVEYGRLEVESSHTVKDAVIALETVARLIGLYAEERRLIEANAALSSELQELEHALMTAKIVARASGVVASLMGVSRATAERWIEDEAVRTRKSLAEISDRIVLNQQAQRLAAPVLRRTA